MIKIKIFSDFNNNSENLVNTFNRVFCGEMYPNIMLVSGDDYTHVVILNTDMPNIKHIPKTNVVGLAYEPFEFLNLNNTFINYAQLYIGKYLIGSKHNLPEPFIEHYSLMTHSSYNSLPTSIPTNKCGNKNIMSIILSNKQFAPGHKYRHDLVKALINNKFPVDIYGRGSTNYNGPYIKGEFVDLEPYSTYKFSICIENFTSNDYISEKIINPILCNCVPLYIGAKNISNYIEKKHVILLTGNLSEDMTIIYNVLMNPNDYYIITNTEQFRNKTNFFNQITNFFGP